MKINIFTSTIFAFIIFNTPLTGKSQTSLPCPISSPATENLGYDQFDITTDGELLVIKRLIADGDLIFDVGANIGEWTTNAIKYHKKIRAFAFEPAPELIAQLKEKFATNNVTISETAVFSVVKTLEFDFYENNTGLGGVYHRPCLSDLLHYQPKKILVKTTTIDNTCIEHNIRHINFLKIDTEGGEFDVLEGASKILSSKNIDIIQFEYGVCYLDSKKTLESIYTTLTNLGYSIFRLYSDGLIYIPRWNKSLENYKLSNYLAIANPLQYPQLQLTPTP